MSVVLKEENEEGFRDVFRVDTTKNRLPPIGIDRYSILDLKTKNKNLTTKSNAI